MAEPKYRPAGPNAYSLPCQLDIGILVPLVPGSLLVKGLVSDDAPPLIALSVERENEDDPQECRFYLDLSTAGKLARMLLMKGAVRLSRDEITELIDALNATLAHDGDN